MAHTPPKPFSPDLTSPQGPALRGRFLSTVAPAPSPAALGWGPFLVFLAAIAASAVFAFGVVPRIQGPRVGADLSADLDWTVQELQAGREPTWPKTRLPSQWYLLDETSGRRVEMAFQPKHLDRACVFVAREAMKWEGATLNGQRIASFSHDSLADQCAQDRVAVSVPVDPSPARAFRPGPAPALPGEF